MAKDRRFSGKLAVGIFVDGLSLQVVCLSGNKGKVRLVDAQILNLVSRLESVSSEDEVLTQQADLQGSAEISPIDITSESQSADLLLTEPEGAGIQQDNASILLEALSKYPARKYMVAISVPEPYIYYASFNTDWGLKGDKLKKRIIDELVKEKTGAKMLKPSDIDIFNYSDGSIVSVVRDAEIGVINLLDAIKSNIGGRIPRISFVESAEISLVNLVKENYKLGDEEISVIIYVGHDFSRLIFLQGNKIYYISPIIGEGIDSFNIANTIYSRLLLEQDNLNISKIDNIILTGEAREAGVKDFLVKMFPEDMNIDYINLSNLDTSDADPLIVESIPRVAVALGSAWRALDTSNKELYSIDLIPFEIREKQKVFKLGVVGWVLLLIIPLLTFQVTTRISQLSSELDKLNIQLAQSKAELVRLQELQKQVEQMRERYAYYKNTFTVLDSMLVGTKTWSSFLSKISRIMRDQVNRLWITNISTLSSGDVVIQGYSIYRNRIPRFTKAIGNATLKKVEVQEIRGKTVYNFEIHVKIPKVPKPEQRKESEK